VGKEFASDKESERYWPAIALEWWG